ncbi:hypothetical protein NVP1170O_094 [Vibrio phage 1.170.O._10N.261.52.C3]|nr:hypothetical protein NVP1170O_094 [Vibrio phage 1.170.O._10N.261.52.C3]
MKSKYRIVHRLYTNGKETYTIQTREWLFWLDYTEHNGYGGDTVFVYGNLDEAKNKIKTLSEPEIKISKEDYIYLKEKTDE